MQKTRSELPTEERRILDGEVARFGTLEQVVRWAFAQTPPSDVADVVVQDEYSHDVVIPWRRWWLVFDTT